MKSNKMKAPVRGFIVILGILVALLIGMFTLHAKNTPFTYFGIGPDSNNRLAHLDVDTENIQVRSSPVILVYDKNFELILSTNVSAISQYEKEHLTRLLNICELLVQNEETTIYWLDK